MQSTQFCDEVFAESLAVVQGTANRAFPYCHST